MKSCIKSFRFSFILSMISLLLILGCSTGMNDSIPPEKDIEPIDPIQEQIKGMSLEEKIGQLFILGLEGYESDDYSRKFIEDYHVGGFIFFKRNIKDSNQFISLVNSLKDTNSINEIPLFLGVDEEGGRVSRMPEEFLRMPSSQRIASTSNSDLAFEVGNIIGEEVKGLGLNMNFAPVLDINSNPNNPVIGDRSFGDDASLVSEFGSQAMRGIRSQGIITVVKHFPGHGDTVVDSHVGLPTIYHDLSRLRSVELVPFSEAIENDVDAMMMAHILLPEIDSEFPASLSKNIITELLRNDMGFDGVVITDDMTMGAVIENYDIGEAAIRTIKAGSDIVLVCHDYALMEAAINAIKKAVDTEELSEKRVDESVERILKLKQKYALSNKKSKPIDPNLIEDINNKIEKAIDKT